MLTRCQDLLQAHLVGLLSRQAGSGAVEATVAGGGAQVGLLGNHRVPLQLLHQLLAVLRVDKLVDALMTNVRLWLCVE